ncbi:hypothetical protein Ancab_025162 [Ancistrocladus abbreviatus]
MRLNLKVSPETGRLSPPFHDENACRFHLDILKAEVPDCSFQELEGYATGEQIEKLSYSLSPSLGAIGSENENLKQLTESPFEEVNTNVPDSVQHSPRRDSCHPHHLWFRRKSGLERRFSSHDDFYPAKEGLFSSPKQSLQQHLHQHGPKNVERRAGHVHDHLVRWRDSSLDMIEDNMIDPRS